MGANISRHVFRVNETGRPLCPPVRDVRPAAGTRSHGTEMLRHFDVKTMRFLLSARPRRHLQDG